jgi:hypothetical protein
MKKQEFENCKLQTRSDLCIPRKETTLPHSQFLYIHVSLSDLYIPTIGAPILLGI